MNKTTWSCSVGKYSIASMKIGRVDKMMPRARITDSSIDKDENRFHCFSNFFLKEYI